MNVSPELARDAVACLGVLHDAGRRGLLLGEWRERALAAGVAKSDGHFAHLLGLLTVDGVLHVGSPERGYRWSSGFAGAPIDTSLGSYVAYRETPWKTP